MAAITAKRACTACRRWTLQEFTAVMAANGVRQIRPHCMACGADLDSIAHHALRMLGIEPVDVRVTRDNRDIERVCEVGECGSIETEYHHFAPSSVFDERVPHPVYTITTTASDIWPGAWLCRAHHTEWHQRMTGYQPNRGHVAA